jgi:hypothetical protein
VGKVLAMAVIGLVLCTAPVLAQPLPVYDATATCAESLVPLRSIPVLQDTLDQLKQSCEMAQGMSYDMLNMTWRMATEQVKRECLRRQDPAVDPMHRPPTYGSLLSCVSGGAP